MSPSQHGYAGKTMRDYAGLWIGTVDGAISGTISLELRQLRETLRGSANLYSPLYGTSVYVATGAVDPDNGTYCLTLRPEKGHPYPDPEILVAGSLLPTGELAGEFRLSGASMAGVLTASRQAPQPRTPAEHEDGWVFDEVLRRYARREAAAPIGEAARDWSLLKSAQGRLKHFLDAYLKVFDLNVDSQVFFLEASRHSGAWRLELPGEQERYAAYPDMAARLRVLGNNPDRGRHLDIRALAERLNADPHLNRTHHILIAGQSDGEDALLPLLLVKRSLLTKNFAFAEAVPTPGGETAGRSFIHAVLDRLLLSLAGRRVAERLPRITPSTIRNLHEEAARALLDRAALAARDPASVSGRLYDSINTVAALSYERRDCSATMLFVAGGSLETVCDFDARFKTPVQLSETRKTRKLLEATNHSAHLITDGGLIYGIGRRKPAYRHDDDSVFLLEIPGHAVWCLYANQHLLLRCEEGRLSVDKQLYDQRALAASASAHLRLNAADRLRGIQDVVDAAARLGHGSILVFSEAAAGEAARLAHEGFMVEPFPVTPANIGLYTAIDGAVLLDARCACHGFGVILDGLTISDKSKIRSDRGARYNSALRYFEKNAGAGGLFIVVISDDETVDFFPASV